VEYSSQEGADRDDLSGYSGSLKVICVGKHSPWRCGKYFRYEMNDGQSQEYGETILEATFFNRGVDFAFKNKPKDKDIQTQ
jgi:hypothetical protein